MIVPLGVCSLERDVHLLLNGAYTYREVNATKRTNTPYSDLLEQHHTEIGIVQRAKKRGDFE